MNDRQRIALTAAIVAGGLLWIWIWAEQSMSPPNAYDRPVAHSTPVPVETPIVPPTFTATNGPHLISPEGHVHVGTAVYLNGERLFTVKQLTSRNPFTGRAEEGVLFDYMGREDYRPMWALIQNFRVREDEQ